MSRVIWKFPLPLDESDANGRHHISMPSVSAFLALQLQYDIPTAWFQVEPGAPTVTRTFEWVGTGGGVGHFDGTYLGTVQVDEGRYVFHLYEVKS